MLTGPPPNFNGTRDIVTGSSPDDAANIQAA